MWKKEEKLSENTYLRKFADIVDTLFKKTNLVIKDGENVCEASKRMQIINEGDVTYGRRLGLIVTSEQDCKKARSTIQGFINNDENHIEVLIVWFEAFVEYDDALKSFISKFKQVYKDIIKKSYKSKAKVDMKRIFQQSKSQTNTMVNGSKDLDEATNAASERLILRLKRSPKV